MTEQISALAIAMGASESQREVLEPLCAAAERVRNIFAPGKIRLLADIRLYDFTV